MVTLVVEDGTGKTDSNTYISLALADSYFSTQLRAETWTGATSDDRSRSLIMATQQLDNLVRWRGSKKTSTQARQWPRNYMTDYNGWAIPSDEIPVDVQEATCELAKALLTQDRTADPDVTGFKKIKVDVIELEVDKNNITYALPRLVMAKISHLVRSGAGFGIAAVERS